MNPREERKVLIQTLSKKEVEVIIFTEITHTFFVSQYFRIFGVSCTVEEIKGSKVILIRDYSVNAEVKKQIKYLFDTIIKPKTEICFRISESEFQNFNLIAEQEKAPFLEEKALLEAEKSKLIEAMPKKLVFSEAVIWGDYGIESCTRIDTIRYEDENWRVHETVFDAGQDGSLFNEELRNTVVELESIGKCGIFIFYEISQEVSEKLIESYKIGKKIQDEGIAEKQRKKQESLDLKLKKEAERVESIKKESAETGKPVLLYSSFLGGSDIPYKYRDEDSDMGTLSVYAMPDGTTVEGFNHAY